MADDGSEFVPQSARSALLSGLGFYKLSRRRQKQLSLVFFGSLIFHVVALLIFGGYVIMTSRKDEPTIFRTPPPTRKYEPRKLEHKVKVQKRQRSSSRPAMVPRLVSMQMTQLALPEIKVDPKLVNTTFQPKFKAVSGKGLGAGLGTGYGTHGFGLGVSSFNFFGIHAKGEKVAVLVDVSVSMVEDERGGVAGYWRVKERINQVIDALGEGTLFSLILFADAAKTMEKKMVIASADNKTKAKLFLRPFNTEGNWGLTDGNIQASAKGLRAGGGTTRLDLALTGAFLQGADTILIISDGIPRVKKVWSQEQIQGFQNQRAAWQQANAGAIAAYNTAQATASAAGSSVSEKVWVPATPEQIIPARPPSKSPPKEGQPVDRGSPRRVIPAQPGHWKVITRRVGGGGGGGPRRPQPPPIPDPGWWTLSDFIEHLTILHKGMYEEKGMKQPVVHSIGYQIDNDGHAFLMGLSKHYKGQYRRVQKLR